MGGDDDGVVVEGVFLLGRYVVDADGQSEYPVGESEGVIIELEWAFELLIRNGI